jgi:transposase-like protein
MMPGGIVLIVENDPAVVEADLAAGVVACPACGGCLAPWSFARRRNLRDEAGQMTLRPRRGRCRSCGKTQVLLPDVALARRVDTMAVIGRALTAAAGGLGHRRAARRVNRPASTVRGWLRRFAAAAARVAAHFMVWAHALDPNLAAVRPAGSVLGDALEAIGVAARAASLRHGPRPAWSWASALSAGRLLSNTNSPWPTP